MDLWRGDVSGEVTQVAQVDLWRLLVLPFFVQRLQQNLAVFPLGKEACSGDETKRKEDRMPMSIAALAKS